MSNRVKKWLFFILSIAAYFVPYIVVTACLFPMMEVATGYKVAVGMVIVVINAIPFLAGVFRSFTAHYPMFTVMPFLFCAVGMFFTADMFQDYVDSFLWIEFTVGIGMIASCILWRFYRKYSHWLESDKWDKSRSKKVKETDSE